MVAGRACGGAPVALDGVVEGAGGGSGGDVGGGLTGADQVRVPLVAHPQHVPQLRGTPGAPCAHAPVQRPRPHQTASGPRQQQAPTEGDKTSRHWIACRVPPVPHPLALPPPLQGTPTISREAEQGAEHRLHEHLEPAGEMRREGGQPDSQWRTAAAPAQGAPERNCQRGVLECRCLYGFRVSGSGRSCRVTGGGTVMFPGALGTRPSSCTFGWRRSGRRTRAPATPRCPRSAAGTARRSKGQNSVKGEPERKKKPNLMTGEHWLHQGLGALRLPRITRQQL